MVGFSAVQNCSCECKLDYAFIYVNHVKEAEKKMSGQHKSSVEKEESNHCVKRLVVSVKSCVEYSISFFCAPWLWSHTPRHLTVYISSTHNYLTMHALSPALQTFLWSSHFQRWNWKILVADMIGPKKLKNVECW